MLFYAKIEPFGERERLCYYLFQHMTFFARCKAFFRAFVSFSETERENATGKWRAGTKKPPDETTGGNFACLEL